MPSCESSHDRELKSTSRASGWKAADQDAAPASCERGLWLQSDLFSSMMTFDPEQPLGSASEPLFEAAPLRKPLKKCGFCRMVRAESALSQHKRQHRAAVGGSQKPGCTRSMVLNLDMRLSNLTLGLVISISVEAADSKTASPAVVQRASELCQSLCAFAPLREAYSSPLATFARCKTFCATLRARAAPSARTLWT